MCRWTRIGVMAADMWWRIWTRIGGEDVAVVYGSGNEVGAVVVYGSSDDDDMKNRLNLNYEKL